MAEDIERAENLRDYGDYQIIHVSGWYRHIQNGIVEFILYRNTVEDGQKIKRVVGRTVMSLEEAIRENLSNRAALIAATNGVPLSDAETVPLECVLH